MHHTPEDQDSQRADKRPNSGTRPHFRLATRAATAAAALAALGVTGAAAAHATPDDHQPTPAQDESRPEGPVRTVMPGDSLWSVATANGISVEELMEFNDLHGDAALKPGQHLRLSAPAEADAPQKSVDAAAVAEPAEPADNTQTEAPATTEHTVVRGDSLWELARTHDVTVAEIIEANDLDVARALSTGHVLTIPAADAGPQAPAASEPGQPSEQSGPTPQAVTNNFPGHDYDDDTVAAANESHAALAQRPQVSAQDLKSMVRSTAEDMGVDPALALAHAEQESGFNHQVVSPANAIGTMQVIPAAGEWAELLVGRELDLLDPQDNVTAGVAIIRANTQRADNDDQAIAAYYQGLHGVQEYGMFDDTKRYVSQVKAKLNAWS